MAHWEHRPEPKRQNFELDQEEKREWGGYTELLEEKALVRARRKRDEARGGEEPEPAK